MRVACIVILATIWNSDIMNMVVFLFSLISGGTDYCTTQHDSL